jgi:hypothetical protein
MHLISTEYNKAKSTQVPPGGGYCNTAGGWWGDWAEFLSANRLTQRERASTISQDPAQPHRHFVSAKLQPLSRWPPGIVGYLVMFNPGCKWLLLT